MLRRLARHVVMLVGMLAAAVAHAQPFSSAEQAGEWITFYYRKPEPDRLPEALRVLSKEGMLKQDKGGPPITGFLSGVFRTRPQAAGALAGRLGFLPEDEQSVLLLALWYAAIPEAKAILKDLSASMPGQRGRIEFLVATPGRHIVEIPPDQGAWVLDAWWGFFLATGDELPIRAIIAVLPWTKVRGDTGRLLIGGAARWSLISNAIQHGRVLEICKAQLAVQGAEVAELLKEVVSTAEAERAKRK